MILTYPWVKKYQNFLALEMKIITIFFILVIYYSFIFMHRRVKNQSGFSIGKQIRELRKARGMTLADLAKEIDRSVGYISQAERDKSEVTIASLNLIAKALNVDLSWFFNQQQDHQSEESIYIVRADNRRQLNFIGAGMAESLLSPNLNGESLMILNESQPGATSGDLIRRDVEMSGYVLSGTLKLILETNEFVLNQGDSFVLPRNVLHDFENIGEDNCQVIWYLTPAIY